MWGRCTLIPAKLINKMSIFTFMFSKKIYMISIFIEFFFLMFILLSNDASVVAMKISTLSLKELIICYLIVFIISISHELGHAIALMYSKEKPGRIGVAIYFIMPVLFSDVTNSWRLNRKKRFLVDSGGLYMQLWVTMALYLWNTLFFKKDILLLAILVSTLEILGNLNPFIKLDGYWMLSDVLGLTNTKETIIEIIKNLFKVKSKKNPIRIQGKKKCILYLYVAFAVGFYVYFGSMLINSIIYSIVVIKNDIYFLVNNSVIFSIDKIFNYISGRFTTFVVVIFVIRLLLKGITNVVIRVKNDYRKI